MHFVSIYAEIFAGLQNAYCAIKRMDTKQNSPSENVSAANKTAVSHLSCMVNEPVLNAAAQEDFTYYTHLLWRCKPACFR